MLAGTGDGANWLRAHAVPGSRVATRETVVAERGGRRIARDAGIVNGGPRLLRAGAIDIPAFAEGFLGSRSPHSRR